jgi:hypothetical protein
VGFIGVATRVSCVSVWKVLRVKVYRGEAVTENAIERNLETHSIGVAMLVVAHVLVAIARGNSGLTHDDHAGWATINAKTTTSAHVFVDDENDMIVGIGSGRNDVDGVSNGAGRKHVNALPRANVYAAFAHDAFGLVNVEKLLGLDALV